jgi:hypothetical protein
MLERAMRTAAVQDRGHSLNRPWKDEHLFD